jgi:hypothetical protein
VRGTDRNLLSESRGCKHGGGSKRDEHGGQKNKWKRVERVGEEGTEDVKEEGEGKPALNLRISVVMRPPFIATSVYSLYSLPERNGHASPLLS